MGIDVYGWVQVNFVGNRWESILKIDPLFARAYPAFSWLNEAAHSGMPFLDADPAPPPCSEDEPAAEEDEEIGHDLIVFDGHAWISWSEILALDWSKATEEMHVLLELMHTLAQTFAPEKVRLVYWFVG